jgi:tetratricopeptide (TPR) repeat protein
MEILIILLPKFFVDWLSGNLDFSEEEYTDQKNPIRTGIEMVEKEDFLGAFYYFNEFIEVNPKNFLAHYFRGRCHFYFENFEAANLDFDKSIRLDNTFAEAFELNAKCLYLLEKYEDSLKNYKRFSRKQNDKNAEILRIIGELEIRTNDFESARKTLKLAINLGDKEAKNLYENINFEKEPA